MSAQNTVDQRQVESSIRMARKGLRYFWRELFWDSQRPQSLCTYAAVLYNFGEMQGDQQVNEKLWLTNIVCDGCHLHGVLEQAPQHLTSIQQGANYMLPIDSIDDWIYVLNGRAFGAFSIHLLRAKMDPTARAFHDKTWGFEFGKPNAVSMYPRPEAFQEEEPEEEEVQEPEEPKKFLGITLSKPKAKSDEPKKFFGVKMPKRNKAGGISPLSEQLGLTKVNIEEVDQIKDHPFAIELEDTLQEHLKNNPELIHATNEMGWTLLHSHSLAGSRRFIKILLELGANPHALTPDGKSPRMLAKSLQWREVMGILAEAEKNNPSSQ